MKGGIYKITNPKGKVYIGKSVDVERRMGEYSRLSCEDQPLLYNSLLKYGFDSHIIDLLIMSDDDDYLKTMEIYYIDLYKSNLSRHRKLNVGLNLTDGGDGSTGYKHSEESLAKMSEIKKNTPYSENSVKAMNKAVCKKVIDLNTGIYYDSCTEASKAVGEHRATFQKRLVGKRPNKYNMWYVDDVINNRNK